MDNIEDILISKGLKPTSNRIIVLRELLACDSPLSLGELETRLGTLEKSSILRVLTLFLEHHIVHDLEDGRGVINYEVCHRDSEQTDNDMHVHFYCRKCRRLYCFEDIPVPQIPLPEGFRANSVNYMLKGICPSCGSFSLPE